MIELIVDNSSINKLPSSQSDGTYAGLNRRHNILHLFETLDAAISTLDVLRQPAQRTELSPTCSIRASIDLRLVHRAREVEVESLEGAALFMAQEAFVCSAVPRLRCSVRACGLWRAQSTSSGRDEAVWVRDNVGTIQPDDVVVDGLARDARGAGSGFSVQDESGDGDEGALAVSAWANKGSRLMNRGGEVVV